MEIHDTLLDDESINPELDYLSFQGTEFGYNEFGERIGPTANPFIDDDDLEDDIAKNPAPAEQPPNR